MEGNALYLWPNELFQVTTSQAAAEEQTAAREAVESQLTDAQAKITASEERIAELQVQLSATSKPKVCFYPSSSSLIPRLIYMTLSVVGQESTTSA